MKTREIGESGLVTGVLSLGAWAIGGGSWWGENDDSQSIRTIHSALDQGLNWIDTAPVYGFGHSEEVVGQALKGRRERAVLSTKCGLQWRNEIGSHPFTKDGHSVYRNLSAQSIRKDLEDSLQRLQTDYIDIYYTHWQAEKDGASIQETMEELLKMKQEGKIRVIGASNVTTEHLDEYLKYGKIDVIQEKFSLLDRRVEPSLLPYCEEHKITLQAYSPLEQGLLTGKITMDYKIESGSVHENKFWWMPENRQFAIEMLRGWRDLTQKYSCSLGNLAIAWMVARSEYLNVLGGARTIEQAQENAKAGELVLDLADFERMTYDADMAITNTKV
ncbi:MAG: aldo/keto reductase [Clostridium sp.]|uniref:aldo/keto reductase n=1 Tax=Clostridium sp. TaxID=1506 RepID=UPI00290E6A40|nr:aldo/keto reductase [Clostridium sp.]MDU7336917.1 aldo/keto reductase [Clostridium sp.]